MPKTANELTKITNELQKKVAKLEKEIKRHQNFIEKLSAKLMFLNPILFRSLSRVQIKR